MNRWIVSGMAVMAVALPVVAQDSPMAAELKQSWGRTMGNVVAAAEKMPDEGYSFKPAPESQSFRDLVAHTADSAMGACTGFGGERKTANAAGMQTKAELVGALKAAAAECESVYGAFTDAKATEMIANRGQQNTRMGYLYRNVIHIEHEYAQMAVHLRLKGVVPPSSEGRGGMGKKK